jgi:hypothetical protein
MSSVNCAECGKKKATNVCVLCKTRICNACSIVGCKDHRLCLDCGSFMECEVCEVELKCRACAVIECACGVHLSRCEIHRKDRLRCEGCDKKICVFCFKKCEQGHLICYDCGGRECEMCYKLTCDVCSGICPCGNTALACCLEHLYLRCCESCGEYMCNGCCVSCCVCYEYWHPQHLKEEEKCLCGTLKCPECRDSLCDDCTALSRECNECSAVVLDYTYLADSRIYLCNGCYEEKKESTVNNKRQSTTSTATTTSNKKQKLAPHCDNNNGHLATIYCKDCNENFCKVCDSGLHKYSINTKHTRENIPISEVPDFNINNLSLSAQRFFKTYLNDEMTNIREDILNTIPECSENIQGVCVGNMKITLVLAEEAEDENKILPIVKQTLRDKFKQLQILDQDFQVEQQ